MLCLYFQLGPVILPLILMVFVFGLTKNLFRDQRWESEYGLPQTTTTTAATTAAAQPETAPKQIQTCSAVSNIYLLKMHKTGSTTLYGIISRMALRKSLRFAVYEKRPYDSNKRDSLVRNIIPPFTKQSQKYNVVADHSRYDILPLQKILTQPAAHIAFIRNPVSLTRSWVHYYSVAKALNITESDPIVTLLAKKDTYSVKGRRIIENARDTVADTFRIPKSVLPTSEMFKSHVYHIRNKFVVGITEYFSESLVLIRRRMCWSLKELLFVPLRISRYMKPGGQEDEKIYKSLCDWARLDCALYEYFNKSLWKTIKEQGEGFTNEVLYFDLVQKRVEGYCTPVYREMQRNLSKIFILNKETPPVGFPKTEWGDSFTIGVIDCALMRIDEFQYSNIFYYIQNRGACDVIKSGANTTCRIQPKLVGPNFCKLLCTSTDNPWTMVMNVLTEKRTYLWS